MPIFVLCLKAKLENVSKVELPFESQFDITLKNCNSDETRDVILSGEQELPLSTGRGTAHFVMKWERDSKSEVTVSVIPIKGVTKPMESEDSETFVPMVAFECRGVEPVAFRPRNGFVVELPSGKTLEDVDLSDLDWCDFDEGSGVSVGIYEIESRFEVHRK